jgi:hypothetical protein
MTILVILFVILLSVPTCLFAEDNGDGGGEGKSLPKGVSRDVNDPYVQLGPITITVIKDSQILGYIRFTCLCCKINILSIFPVF